MTAYNLGPPGKGAAPVVSGGGEVERLASGSMTSTVPEVTVRGGRVVRTRLRHAVGAGCQTCGAQWLGSLSFVRATRHTERTGHVTVAGRCVVYGYRPAGGAR